MDKAGDRGRIFLRIMRYRFRLIPPVESHPASHRTGGTGRSKQDYRRGNGRYSPTMVAILFRQAIDSMEATVMLAPALSENFSPFDLNVSGAAQRFVAQGVPIVPVNLGSKIPAIHWTRYQNVLP